MSAGGGRTRPAWVDSRLRREAIRQKVLGDAVPAGLIELDWQVVDDLDAYLASQATFRFSHAARTSASRTWSALPRGVRLTASAGVIATAGTVAVAGAVAGNRFPDRDIKLLGIGTHRFWAFHSAAGAWMLREFCMTAAAMSDGRSRPPAAVRLAAAVASGGAAGIGVHLLKDGAFGLLDGRKSVVIGIPGVWLRHSIVRGTYVDDDAWLLGNALWCLKISRELAVLACGPELDIAREWALQSFRDWSHKTEGDNGAT